MPSEATIARGQAEIDQYNLHETLETINSLNLSINQARELGLINEVEHLNLVDYLDATDMTVEPPPFEDSFSPCGIDIGGADV